jgi:hypothetical protein
MQAGWSSFCPRGGVQVQVSVDFMVRMKQATRLIRIMKVNLVLVLGGQNTLAPFVDRSVKAEPRTQGNPVARRSRYYPVPRQTKLLAVIASLVLE